MQMGPPSARDRTFPMAGNAGDEKERGAGHIRTEKEDRLIHLFMHSNRPSIIACEQYQYSFAVTPSVGKL